MNLAFFSTARGAWPEHSKLCLDFKVGTTPSFTSLNSHLIVPSIVRASLYFRPGLPLNVLIKHFSCYEVRSKTCRGLALALEGLKQSRQAVPMAGGAFLKGAQTSLACIARMLEWSLVIL